MIYTYIYTLKDYEIDSMDLWKAPRWISIVSYLSAECLPWEAKQLQLGLSTRGTNWPRLSQATFGWCLQPPWKISMNWDYEHRQDGKQIKYPKPPTSENIGFCHLLVRIYCWSLDPFGGSISVNIHCYSIHHHKHPPISNNGDIT